MVLRRPSNGLNQQQVDLHYGTGAGRWVLLAMVLGSGMAFLDATVVNIALPRIGKDFHASAAGLQWTVNAYTLTLAALILLGGSLGDRFGRRRIFVIGVGWFAIASLLCGISPNIESLIAARALQGIGGALLTPGALAILEATFDQDDRSKAIGAWSGLAGITGAIGPFLGGWLVEVSTWRLVFLINVPIAAVVILITLWHVPETSNPQAAQQLDIAGAVAGAVGLAGLTLGFTAWPDNGPGNPLVFGSLLVGMLGLVGFVMIERRSSHPMLPLTLFRSRPFTAANLVTFAVYAALGGVFFLVVINLQVVAGFSPIAAGVALLPVTALMLLLSARAGALSGRIGPRLPMTLGPLICAGALVWLSRVGFNANYVTDVLPPVIILGLGLSLTVAPLTATALGSVDDQFAGVASGVNNAIARAAGLLAVAVLPLAAGLGHGSLTNAGQLHPAYRNSMLLCAGLLVIGGGIAATMLKTSTVVEAPCHSFCPVAGPPLNPAREEAAVQ